MEKAIKYIHKITGLETLQKKKPVEALNELPLFIKKGYDFYCAELHNHDVVFVEPNGDDPPKPSQLQKHIPKIESAFECPAILILEKTTYYLRERLANSRLAFVIPEKQLFIPFMFISLDEQKHIKRTRTEKYSPSTQFVLIHHLYKSPIDGLNFKEIADLFFYTPKTIGRCARELEDSGVCDIVGSKAKYLEFKQDRWEIWDTAKKYMRSPIKKTGWLFEFEKPEKAKISGINALAAYSNILGEDRQTYAIDRSLYKQMKQEEKVHEDDIYEEGDIKIELWGYDPSFLAKDEYVDPFSLYLTLQDNPNERIQMSIKKMIEKIL